MGKMIDLDETMKNLAKANMNRTGNEFERFLLSQSTVEAIPLSVIDDIKAEIENLPTGVELTDGSIRDFTFKNYKKGLLKMIDEEVKGYTQ